MIFFRTLRKQRDTAIAIGTACMARYVAETDALRAELREAQAAIKYWRDCYDGAWREQERLAIAANDHSHEISHYIAQIDMLTEKLARFTAPRKRGVHGHYLPLSDKP